MIFAHGFGCDQNMWRFVEPAFASEFKTVLFDHVGAGGSDLKAYDKAKYSTLAGYADDVVEIGRELGLADAVFVGHSVSSMIGALAAQKAPGMFGKLVMIGPSPRYIDDGDYIGGFSEAADRRASPVPRIQSHGLVGADGARDHGQSRSARARRGADQQLLPNRSGHRQGIRAGHFQVRQPGGPRQGRCSDADPSMQRRHYRVKGSWRICPSRNSRTARSSSWRLPGIAPISARPMKSSRRCEPFV